MPSSPPRRPPSGSRRGSAPSFTKLADEAHKEFLLRLIVQYDFNDDLAGYASCPRGVNVGVNTFHPAFFSLPPFAVDMALNELGLSLVQKPEKLTNYEIGFKGRLADGRIQFQSALYYAIWEDEINNRRRTEPDRPVDQRGGGTGAPLPSCVRGSNRFVICFAEGPAR